MKRDKLMGLREAFNSTVRKDYQESHVPQCRRCMRFHPWGNSIMQIHHIRPLVDGGSNEYGNLVTLCADCHNEWHNHCEGKMDFNEWLQSAPRWTYAAVGLLGNENMKGVSFAQIGGVWWRVREERMLSEPLKPEVKSYTVSHCGNWIDW